MIKWDLEYASDIGSPVIGYVLGFVVLMIPLGWWLTTHGGWDERGLVLAVIVACVLTTILLAWRFRVLTRVRT